MPWENDTTWVFRSTGRCLENVYDGIIDSDGKLMDQHAWRVPDLTAEERAELADEMIARWQRFKLGDAAKNAVIDNGILWGSCPVAADIGTDAAGRALSARQGQPLGKGIGHHWGSPCESCGAVKHRG